MDKKIAVIGLGYVGLPLLDKLSQHYKILAYDLDKTKIKFLKNNNFLDELNQKKFFNINNINFFEDLYSLKDCNFFIICVPTPVFSNNFPDFSNIKSISKSISKIIKPKDIIVYESTFYPGATKDIIIPILEKYSKLKCSFSNGDFKLNKDKFFSVGYSPERINPGDAKHTIDKVIKIISASNKNSLKIINNVYSKIVNAGIHKAPSIEIAEGSKVIENIQRDLNIALINELKIIFDKLKIDFDDVLKAAGTKWNFNKFTPGMVGGHCISVDPYYLSYRSKKIGYNPKILLAGRNINNNMHRYFLSDIKSKIKINFKHQTNIKILIMGFAYKEDVSDFRNTQVISIYKGLKKIYKNTHVFDPLVDKNDVRKKYKLKIIDKPKRNFYDFVLILVNHNIFYKKNNFNYKNYGKKNSVHYFLKKK